jgi:general secretion pathway protein D
MKSFARARSFVALLLAAFLIASPLTALAKKGEKNFKRGMQFEQAQQWDKAAQEFALAVAAAPSDTEYQLHYRRAIFNASQVFMQKGRALADQGDYVGAYNAFRQAYGYDPVNELASQEMNRVMRLQREKEGGDPKGADISPTSFRRGARPNGVGAPNGTGAAKGAAREPAQPERVEQLQNINYNGELEPFIRRLADELGLNVIFDQNFAQVKRNINLKLKDVTAARALDHIFVAYGLFYQKLDRRTIIVADQSKRPQYQQLVLRTFYLYNIKPDQARQLLQSALPPNAGRQPAYAINDNTNSITVRDTPENIRIIGQLLQGIDKDRSEVVMEVSIYEVSRTDLLQIGNQLGTGDTLAALGGLQPSTVLVGRGARTIVDAASKTALPLASGLGLLIPASTISALQTKNNTRLIFSTQVHAFDDEKSETRVGSKVPVQTASVFNSLAPAQQQGGGATGGTAGTSGVFGGGGFPVIQYEDTGLVLDFKPKVYPNQDVQVTMNIETKGVEAGPDPLTPIFTQRKISGVARIPNGKTMMIASVAQDRQITGRSGLPLLGLIPILGRLFTAPKRDNATSDVVITMTPRVLRAPEITPDDEETRDTGSMQQPKSESLEAMLIDAEREEHLARVAKAAREAARSLPTNQTVQLPPPPGEEVSFVPAPKALADASANLSANNAGATTTTTTTTAAATPAANTTAAPATEATAKTEPPAAANTSAKTPDAQTAIPSSTSAATSPQPQPAPASLNEGAKPQALPVVNTAATPTTSAAAGDARPAAATESTAELLLVPERQEMKVGEKRRVMVFLKTDAPIGLATATLRFDPRALAVRSVSQGILTADASKAPALNHSVDASGVLLVSVSPAAGAQPLTGEGLLLIIEVEALAAGEAALTLDADKLHLIASDGRKINARFNASGFKVTQ